MLDNDSFDDLFSVVVVMFDVKCCCGCPTCDDISDKIELLR